MLEMISVALSAFRALPRLGFARGIFHTSMPADDKFRRATCDNSQSALADVEGRVGRQFRVTSICRMIFGLFLAPSREL